MGGGAATPRARSSEVEGTVAVVAPVATAERIFAVDVLRGVAVLGILLINIEDFALPHADKSAPGTEWVGAYLPADFSARDVVVWTLVRTLFEGKMRAIFSMLFGAGAVLLTSHVERRAHALRSADIYYRRTLWLLAIGLLHAYLLWEGDILFSYALSGLFLFPFRGSSPRLLHTLGALVLSRSVPRAAAIAMHRQDLRAQTSQARADVAAGRPSRARSATTSTNGRTPSRGSSRTRATSRRAATITAAATRACSRAARRSSWMSSRRTTIRGPSSTRSG